VGSLPASRTSPSWSLRCLRRFAHGARRYDTDVPNTLHGVVAALRFLDEDGQDVELDTNEAAALMAVTDELEAATVSACAQCRSRVLATVAFIDLLDAAQPHPRSGDLIELADDAPTLHLYVLDLTTECKHARWRDPGFAEWLDVIEGDGPSVRS
jgi:hypothetical protein